MESNLPTEPPPVEHGVVIDLASEDLIKLRARPRPYVWFLECLHAHPNFACKYVKYVNILGTNLQLCTSDAQQSKELLQQLRGSIKLHEFEICSRGSTVQGLIQGEYWLKVSYRLEEFGADTTRALLADEARKDLEKLVGDEIETILWYSPDRLVFQLRTFAPVKYLDEQTHGFTRPICVGGYRAYSLIF